MSKEGVEVRFCAEMEDVCVMGVVDVCEHAKKLSVDVFDGGREALREVVTGLCRKNVLVIEEILYPSHDIVNISWRWQMDALALLVYPCIVQT